MQAVLNYLQQNKARFLGELCDYVRFPSVSAQPAHRGDMVACAEWLVARCKKIGLEARLCPTNGHPVVVAKTPRSPWSAKPSFLVYGHYDVQPAEPFELWKSPPFEPRIEGRSLFARGASDNKGQNLAHLNAVEAYLATKTPLPCDLTFIIEGEEEVGSRSLESFLLANREELQCRAVVISDTGMPEPGSSGPHLRPARHLRRGNHLARAVPRFAFRHLRRHGGQSRPGPLPVARPAARQKRAHRHSRLLRRCGPAFRLREETNGPLPHEGVRLPKVPGCPASVWRARL